MTGMTDKMRADFNINKDNGLRLIEKLDSSGRHSSYAHSVARANQLHL